jgi:hypothetical protein
MSDSHVPTLTRSRVELDNLAVDAVKTAYWPWVGTTIAVGVSATDSRSGDAHIVVVTRSGGRIAATGVLVSETGQTTTLDMVLLTPGNTTIAFTPDGDGKVTVNTMAPFIVGVFEAMNLHDLLAAAAR